MPFEEQHILIYQPFPQHFDEFEVLIMLLELKSIVWNLEQNKKDVPAKLQRRC